VGALVSRLEIEGLKAEVAGREVLHGIDLVVPAGEVHAVMGPNGSGKSTLAHALMGRPGTQVTEGSIRLDGVELVGKPTAARARAGLFLALQQPIEVPGVTLEAALAAAAPERAPEELHRAVEQAALEIGLEPKLLRRSLNADLSGGERKRSEVVQLEVLRRRLAILDEIDSGLDVDALAAIGQHLNAAAASEWQLGVLAITHFQRLLEALRADRIHVLVDGRIVDDGGPELAHSLEQTGYRAYRAAADPFGF